jgi:hypothetical protein
MSVHGSLRQAQGKTELTTNGYLFLGIFNCRINNQHSGSFRRTQGECDGSDKGYPGPDRESNFG